MNNERVDLVLVDDDQVFVDILADFFKSQNKLADKYSDPNDLMDNISKYPKNVRFCIDYNLNSAVNGLMLAKKLYAMGYSYVYLFSGIDFDAEEVPSYLNTIVKTDIDSLYTLFND